MVDRADDRRPAITAVQHRADAGGSRPSADAGERDVADAVADQGQAALHEVDADRRRGEPDEQRRRPARAA